MGFLNYGTELEVFGKLHEFTDATSGTVEKLLLVVQQFHSGAFQDMEKLMLDTSAAETAADQIKSDIRRLVTESTFLPKLRTDILELTQRVENIADASETTSKIFYITETLMKAQHKKIPKPVLDAILELTEYGVELSKKTAEAISFLPKSVEKIKPLAAEIGKKQDDANDLELEALRMIIDSKMVGFLKSELIDMVRMCGNLTDRCNSAVHVLTYMLFTNNS